MLAPEQKTNRSLPDNQPPATVDPVAHVRQVVADSGSSFFWGMRILPQERRDAMYAIYAFCREVDDVADEPGSDAAKAEQLAEWRAEIERLYERRPTRPTTLALVLPVESFNLPKEEFLAIIEGMEMDAQNAMFAPPMDQLTAYCRRVAGAVGLLSIRVFGATKPPADEFALTLGDALQLTNILRDVREDADMGRLYLPRDLLVANGIEIGDIDSIVNHPNLPAVCKSLSETAALRFEQARDMAAQCDRNALRPALIMMDVYERILRRLVQRGWQTLHPPVKLSKPEKLWIVARRGLF
ncbi:MAG: presqualene diphosphate synthase HpnD [Minwuiales bacterium]|nr:presqualene diphosphate synthase HpnD [Minwuiales bacterium]